MKKLSIAFAAVLGLSVAPLACVQAGPPKAAANFNASAGLGNEDQNELIEQLLDLLDPDAVQSGGLRDQDDEDRADPFDDLQDQHGKALGHEKEKGHEKKRHRAGSSSSGIAKGDFNGDGFADLAIGVPEKNTPVGVVNSGAVIVIYGSANGLTTTDPTVPAAQFWSQNTPGVPGVSHAGDHFGSALAAGDFNDDGISDLAIRAPDKIVAEEGVCAGVGAGFVIYGSPSGLTAGTNP